MISPKKYKIVLLTHFASEYLLENLNIIVMIYHTYQWFRRHSSSLPRPRCCWAWYRRPPRAATGMTTWESHQPLYCIMHREFEFFLLVVAFWRYCWASIRSCEHRSNQLFYSYLSGTVVISCFNHACPAPVLIWHSSDQLLYLYLSCTAVNNSVTNNCSNQLFKPVPVRHSSELLSRPSSRWVQNHHRSGLNQRL